MRLPPLAALGALVLAAAGLSGCASAASDAAALRLQQPALPSDQAAVWGPKDRLYRSVTVDYVGGLGEPSRYGALLESSLDRAGLLAPTRTSARYALQVNFARPEGMFSGLGDDTWAQYRILNRASNQIIFERGAPASFRASYAPLAGGDGEILGARRGVLAEEGFITRNGQADVQRMSQSIVRFIIRLGAAEQVAFATVVPCLDNAEVTALKGALTAEGIPWRTDNCLAYRQPKTDAGQRFTSFY